VAPQAGSAAQQAGSAAQPDGQSQQLRLRRSPAAEAESATVAPTTSSTARIETIEEKRFMDNLLVKTRAQIRKPAVRIKRSTMFL
jgi:hypothetical protein